jgi:hypothetical protein
MKPAFRLRPVARRRLAWLVVVLLLWQQVAVAAYACVAAQAAPAAAALAVAVHSSSMAMADGCADMTTPVDPLCRQHCQPDHATQVDARTASVPASALSALPRVLVSVTGGALPSERGLFRRERLRAPPPIPRLLFCSLLI